MVHIIGPVINENRPSLNHIYFLIGSLSSLVLVYALTYFSRVSLTQERFVVTVGFLGLAIGYWIYCFISREDHPIRVNFRAPRVELVTIAVLVLMGLTAVVDPLPQPVVVSNTIGPLSVAKALFILGVSSILPGHLVLSTLRLNIRPVLRFVISVHLSIAIVLAMTFAIYSVKASINIMLPLIMVLIGSLLGLRMFLTRRFLTDSDASSFKLLAKTVPVELGVGKWKITLFLLMIASTAIAFTFHFSQTYMIPGDSWRVLQPGVDMLVGKNIVESSLANLEYPLAYGFFMAGLSGLAGIPIVNINMYLFPLAGVNILTFYTLVRFAFQAKQTHAITAALMYGFTGGLGWLMGQILQLKMDFWTISYTTQDMLFSYYFLDNIQFWHRTLAIMFAFVAISSFSIALRTGSRKRWLLICIASLFTVMSYFVHMLPLVFVLPSILYLWYSRGKHSWWSAAVLIISGLTIFGIYDVLVGWYYTSLSVTKIDKEFLPALSIPAEFILHADWTDQASRTIDGYSAWVVTNVRENLLPFFNKPVEYLIQVGGLAISALLGTRLSKVLRTRKHRRKNTDLASEAQDTEVPGPQTQVPVNGNRNRMDRYFYPILLAGIWLGIYVYGIIIWTTFPPTNGLLYEVNRLPWYFLTIRFGIVGLLAVAALFFIKRQERWIGVVSAWTLSVFILGNLWWGPKILSFLFPVVAFLAAYSLFALKEHSNKLAVMLGLQSHSTKVVKAATTAALGILVILATSSYIYGFSQYVGSSSKNDGVFELVSWLYSSIDTEEKLGLFTDEYSFEVALSSLSGHETVVAKDLAKLMTAQGKEGLKNSGARYFVGDEREDLFR